MRMMSYLRRISRWLEKRRKLRLYRQMSRSINKGRKSVQPLTISGQRKVLALTTSGQERKG